MQQARLIGGLVFAAFGGERCSNYLQYSAQINLWETIFQRFF